MAIERVSKFFLKLHATSHGCKVGGLSGTNQKMRRFLHFKKSFKMKLKNTVFLIISKTGKSAWYRNLRKENNHVRSRNKKIY
jgi:hypothetical protein